MNETKIDNDGRAADLLPCHLTTTNHIIDSATALAEHIDTKLTEKKFVGIVWATNGARQIPDVTSARFDDERTYEIRFWQVIGDDNADLTLAHEFRWVKGVGAVELTLTANTAKASSEGSESGKPCVSGWAHKVSYLQHESSGSGDTDSVSEPTSGRTEQDEQYVATKTMTAVEFIQEEDKYGNTVVVDQLFTGEWK
jgi:hypothetical protein